MDLLGTRQVDPIHQSPQTRAYGFFVKGTVPSSLIFSHLVSFLPLTLFAACLPRPTLLADRSVTRLSPRFSYYSAVGLLIERRSPARLRLYVRLPPCPPGTLSVLLRA